MHYLGARDNAPTWLAVGADEATLIDDPAPGTVISAAKAIHVERAFGVALSVSDAYVEAAAVINESLGLPGNGPGVPRAVNDKARMREILRDSAAGAVVAARVSTADEVKKFASETGYPFILKPVDGSGSFGVTLISDADGLGDAIARTVGATAVAPENTWIAEEYLRGPEFSVETFSADGTHHLLAVTEKFKGPNFVEIGHLVPARVSADIVRSMTAEVNRCLDAVGLTEGPAHTEIVLTDKGPRIVETHCRPGGDGIVELVRLAVGLDVQRITFDWLAGRPLNLDRASEPQSAATWFLTPRAGTVSSVSGLDEALSAEGVTEAHVTVAPGAVISELRSSSDRAGAAIATGKTPDEALRRAREAAGRIEVTTEPTS
ncbi:ATP-grasp domain-containing protein [Streptomyces sp. 3211]|uniref:ATP-grasp domain-containing protein n=1 Tax=Streptomyces sp. 3211 TaxID=1964449 RepID=UPI0017CAD237|nr:ATP-grasp domain-containing protein [Streptomyces sp. 3211]